MSRNSKIYTITLLLLMLTGFLSLSLALSPLMKSVTISSSGKILTYVLFDNCNQMDDWKSYSSKDSQHPGYNTLEVDTADKIEGTSSLKGTFAATAPNYGGEFYKSNGTFWNLTGTPLVRFWMKINQTMYSAFKFCIVDGYAWNTFYYNILDQLVVGEWCEVVVDLRLPDSGPSGKIPNLAEVHRISMSYWYGYSIENPQIVWWDNITLWAGPYIPPQTEINPKQDVIMKGENITFNVRILGGEPPYTYNWYVNGTLQTEESNTFTFTPSVVGVYNITNIVVDNRGNSSLPRTAIITVLEPPPEQPPIPPTPTPFLSEVRGAFMCQWGYDPRNWSLVAETCLNYGINTVVIETYLTDFWRDGQVVHYSALDEAINAFHARGFKVHVLVCLGLTPPDPSMRAQQGANRETVNWLCFTKNASRQMLKAVTESLARDYNIDGFMFDYIRWNFATDMCFCDECKAKFIADTGLADVNWPTDVLSDGKYYWQFIEWRMKPINEAVRDIVAWMKAIKPNLMFSAAVFTAFDDCGNYWAMRIGQHVAEWVDQGYLDFICPMLYSPNPTVNGEYLTDSLDYYTGGAEGKIPVIPFITDWNMDVGQPLSIDSFVETVRQMKQRGADGWIVWAYWGPGLHEDVSDIRPYLATLFNEGLMEQVWAIQNLSVVINGDTVTISWTTTIPTKSIIEYSDSKIFNGTIRYGDYDRLFHYKDINYIGGKIIANATLSTIHSFTVSLIDNIYFRIQSIDKNGNTVSSQVYFLKRG